MKDPYQEYCRVYDEHIGPRDEIPILRKLIKKYHPKAESIIEFACGTGEILTHFHAGYEVSGVDISKAMLKIAQAKIPQVEMLHGDMCKVRMNHKADIVLCICNSMNHLLTFKDWRLTFKNAARHLNPGGIFIFDINTETAFKNYSKIEDIIEESGEDIMTASFKPGPRGRMNIHCKIFKHLKDQDYRLIETTIDEQTYPKDKIKSALTDCFSWVKLHDPTADKAGNNTEILYFICGT